MFQNREDAALQLVPLLASYANEDGIVLAIPRGGVPLGAIIARAMQFPLEILLTKKIGHPENPELAIGAVSLVNEVLDDRFTIAEDYVENEILRIRQSLRDRYKKFMGDRHPSDLHGKTVIIVDDGIATGNTIMAAIKMIREQKPAKIIVAVPVAPYRTARKIRDMVDDFICVDTPEDFYGVGQFYHDFGQVSDEEVIEILEKSPHKRG